MRALGVPVVVKNKTGAAGAGVRIVDTQAEIRSIAATFEDPGDFYFERFIAGDVMSYAAMADADGTVQELTYRGAAPPLHPPDHQLPTKWSRTEPCSSWAER